MEKPTSCPYCDSPVVLTSNSEIYGKEYGNGKCYLCRECKASVGVHGDGKSPEPTPLGILATSEMKVLKKCCHELFDPIWKSKKKSRTYLYRCLASKLAVDVKDCHFGHFDTPKLLESITIMSEPNWWV